MDSLCRCFGAHDSADLHESLSDPQPRTSSKVPATPDMKRRTRSLALQDKQWDALFDCNTNSAKVTPPKQRQTTSSKETISLEHAHAVAKAKLAANNNGYRSQKRKRQTPDDIFRSRKQQDRGTNPNPFSRFLSNHPVIANSLCFATPIKDSDEEPDEVPLDRNNSVVSDTNTLNTAEDTITSTLYYEQVKLAGLQQKNPPMPLFNHYQLEAGDDIHKIVATESHSSRNMIDWMREHNNLEVEVNLEDDEEEESPPASPQRQQQQRRRGRVNTDDAPPPMMNASDDSSKSDRSK